MTTVISMLRGINVGGHSQVNMDALRKLYESIGMQRPQTYVQSGNVIFKTEERNFIELAERIERAIEKKFGFRPDVILRTASDWNSVVAKNPFAKRKEIHPGKLAVIFFKKASDREACNNLLYSKPDDEEVHISDRELYIYFPKGMGQSKLFASICRKLNSGTARNWNTVSKLLEIAHKLEPGGS